MTSDQQLAVSQELKIQGSCPARPGLFAVPWTDMENGPKFTTYDDAQTFLREHGGEELQRKGWSFRIVPSDFESAAVSIEDDCS